MSVDTTALVANISHYLNYSDLTESDLLRLGPLGEQLTRLDPKQAHLLENAFIDHFGLAVARPIFPHVERLAERVLHHAFFHPVIRIQPQSESVDKPIANYGEFSVIQGRPDFLMGVSREEALRRLTGPTAIVLNYGQKKTRVVSVLVHGNEPSGFDGMLKWLRDQPTEQPTNVVFLVQNVLAAQATDKPFSLRYKDDTQADLNRQWAPFGTPRESLNAYVAAVYDFLNSLENIDGFLDLHNNSGQNPAYAIMSYPNEEQRHLSDSEDLANLLTDQYLTMVLTGGFDGGVRHMAPALAVECGYLDSPESDRIALEIMRKFLERPTKPMGLRDGDLKPRYAIEGSLRLVQRETIGLHILGASAIEQGVFHLRPDIERYNFQ